MTPHPEITPDGFVAEWRDRKLSERQSAQAHFIQLCRLLGVPAPFDNRALDSEYCFDAITATAGSKAFAAYARTASKAKAKTTVDHGPDLFGGATAPIPDAELARAREAGRIDAVTIVVPDSNGRGFADVWKRGCFCWEYKRQGKHVSLDGALAQLRMYAPSLGNPPLLIVSDHDHFEIHTNFTNYPPTVYRFTLEDLAHPSEEWTTKSGISPLNLLRKAFDTESIEDQFRPAKTVYAITEAFAARVATLADQLDGVKTEDGHPVTRQGVAHFLMQIVFSLFAEDVGLLPADRVTRLIRQGNENPKDFTRKIRSLFAAMSTGGDFGEDTINWFNGGLFKEVATQRIPRLSAGQLGIFITGDDKDWSAIEPSILGTLFERALNPAKRAQIGAHYTSRDDIMLIVEPVVLAPLRARWHEARENAATLAVKRATTKDKGKYAALGREIKSALTTFHDHLAGVSILDPACGSGNFLYVAIQCLLDMEREVLAFAARHDIGVTLKPKVNPKQLHGIEIDEYAAELARISVWIGYLKWKHENAKFGDERPILQPLDTIENRDAILDRGKKLTTPAKWPTTDYIIGNPPFLGSKQFRKWGLAEDYLAALFGAFDLPATSDLCCYWFERARQVIQKHPRTRAGLLATQGIRGGDNRTVLERLKQSGDIFMAWSDREWVLDGAAVHVSMIGFDDGTESHRVCDGIEVENINPDLSVGLALSTRASLVENLGIAFQGPVKVGDFDVDWETASRFLSNSNPDGRTNSDVVKRWIRGEELNDRVAPVFIIDMGDREQIEAAMYSAPFAHIEAHVRAFRLKSKDSQRKRFWWRLGRSGADFREATASTSRYLVTCQTAKYRIFTWEPTGSLPAQTVIAFARDDDAFFGVLQSSIHELWSLEQGTQLETRPRYTPTSTFETFPMPWLPRAEPRAAKDKHHDLWTSISDAATHLDRLRESWLNPPELIAECERRVDIVYREELAAVPAHVRPLVRRSAIMAEACKHPKLKLCTLTNLYNERPAWLRLAHERLDRAVIAAYAATDPKGKWDPEWASIYEPFGAGEIAIKKPVTGKGKRARPGDPPEVIARKREIIARREELDAKILGALLRLNRERAGGGKRTKPKA